MCSLFFFFWLFLFVYFLSYRELSLFISNLQQRYPPPPRPGDDSHPFWVCWVGGVKQTRGAGLRPVFMSSHLGHIPMGAESGREHGFWSTTAWVALGQWLKFPCLGFLVDRKDR